MQSLVPAEQRSLFQIQTDLDNVNSYIKRCREVVESLKETLNKTLNKQPALDNNLRIQTWRQDLVKLEEKLNLPQTVVAVVGNTGAGKSSLVNAMLEQAYMLPTSGMQACTAVVVEISSNNKNNNYEADIQFLSRKEWIDERRLLVDELTGPDGKVRKRQPDSRTDAGIAFSKIKSVYGLVDSIEVLDPINSVTKWLDHTKQISTTCPKKFRNEIDCYIETSVDRKEEQYWPIIKRVQIRLPNCDACSSGAVLVDLPGTQDSNPARDKIAKEYLKTCTAVWVVADINRAVDDKTAKDLLGENFRCQLLMDGQYGDIGFVCTKTDNLTPSEIIRSLKIDAETIPFEDEIRTLEEDQCETKSDITKTNKEIQQLHKDLMAADKTTQVLDSADLDSQDQEKQTLDELQAAVATQEASITYLKTKHQKKEQSKAELEKKLAEIKGKITVKRKTLKAICAKARSEYSQKQLKRDFKAGLREMRRKAEPLDEENYMEDDDDDYDDDYDQDGDDEKMKSTADNLRVFCVSAAEYQKIQNLQPADGQPNVFSTVEETQIPALRVFIHEMTSVRRKTATEQLIRRIGNFVFDIENYILDEGTERLEISNFAKSTLEKEKASLKKKMESVCDNFTDDVRMLITEGLIPKLKDGQASAAENANETCARWGAESNENNCKSGGGLHWPTYKATVARDGVYNSRTFGSVNFNEQLAEPIYRNISISWVLFFSDLLWMKLETCKSQVIEILSVSCKEICKQLQAFGVAETRTERVTNRLISSGNNKLTEMITSSKDHVTKRQREISRLLVPAIQKELEETYKMCACETGKGSFIRMKQIMADAINKKHSCMFENTSQKLQQELDSLERDIIKVVAQECKSLCQDFMMAFEPLWEVSSCRLIRNAIFDSLTSVNTKVRQLYKDAQIEYTERASVPVSDANIPATTQLDTSKLNIPDEASCVDGATASNTQPGSVSEKSLNAGSLATSTVTSGISEPGLVQQEGVDSHNAPSSSFVGIKSEPGTRAASTVNTRGGVPHIKTPGSTTEPASKKCRTEHISSSAPKYSACNWSAANIKQEPVEEKRIRSLDSHNAPLSSFVGIKSEPGTHATSTVNTRGGVPHNETPGSTTEPASKKCKTEDISSSAPKY